MECTHTHHAVSQTTTTTRHVSQECPRLRHFFAPSCWRRSREEAAATTQTVASARTSHRSNTLAESQHHAAPRGPKMARAGEGGSEQNYTATIQETPPPQPELFELSFDEEPGVSRPDRLADVRLQERVQRHAVEKIVVSAPGLPMLDVSVPLMVEQLVEVLSTLFCLLPSRLSTCPRSFSRTSRRESRFARRGWRNSWWKYQQSSASLSRPLTFQSHVAVSVGVVFQVCSQNRVLQLSVEVFMVLAENRVQQRHRHPQFPAIQLMFSTLRMRRLKVFFSHFSLAPKKCEGRRAVECESARALELIRAERSSNVFGFV